MVIHDCTAVPCVSRPTTRSTSTNARTTWTRASERRAWWFHGCRRRATGMVSRVSSWWYWSRGWPGLTRLAGSRWTVCSLPSSRKYRRISSRRCTCMARWRRLDARSVEPWPVNTAVKSLIGLRETRASATQNFITLQSWFAVIPLCVSSTVPLSAKSYTEMKSWQLSSRTATYVFCWNTSYTIHYLREGKYQNHSVTMTCIDCDWREFQFTFSLFLFSRFFPLSARNPTYKTSRIKWAKDVEWIAPPGMEGELEFSNNVLGVSQKWFFALGWW